MTIKKLTLRNILYGIFFIYSEFPAVKSCSQIFLAITKRLFLSRKFAVRKRRCQFISLLFYFLFLFSVRGSNGINNLNSFNISWPFTRCFSYFTLVGSRTIVFGEEYEVYLTRSHEAPSKTNLLLELEGKTSGEVNDYTIPLDFQEKLIKFEVTNHRRLEYEMKFLFSVGATSHNRKLHIDLENT